MRILVVEDEAELAQLLRANFGRRGYAVDLSRTLAEARELVMAFKYDIVLLDLGLPDGDGINLLGELRQRSEGLPIIAITARDSVQDRVIGLNRGADDYVVKPFAMEELVARVQTVLRRPGQPLGLTLEIDDLVFNTATRGLLVGQASLVLPRRELAILELLMRAAGRVVTRESMLDAVYGFEDEPSSNAIEANISRLRRRLQAAGSTAEIKVIRGVGYMLRSSNEGD